MVVAVGNDVCLDHHLGSHDLARREAAAIHDGGWRLDRDTGNRGCGFGAPAA